MGWLFNLVNLHMTNGDLRPLSVTRKTALARDICAFELRHPDGTALPATTAGSHIQVQTPHGVLRPYSLCGDPMVTDCYTIAVKREAQGRGGSVSMVDHLNVGDTLWVGEVENHFELSDKARSFVLVAGGIGITPIMAMMHALHQEGLRPFKLLYLTRDEPVTAFAQELRDSPWAGSVTLHHDHGDPRQAHDLWKWFEKPVAGCHVYCCGPTPLMDAVRDMTGHWPEQAIHFESFVADTKQQADDVPFEVELARSQRQLHVQVGQTLLQALRDSGTQVASSCESGTCGSCKVGLLEGVADHRDMVLLPEERERCIMPCVSRAISQKLVLDL
jgi:phthalate 4,5-dioxygenase reductase component